MKPEIVDCQWNKRIGEIMPGKNDKWWQMDNGIEEKKINREIISALKEYALPQFDEVANGETLRVMWEQGKSSGITDGKRLDYLIALRKQ